MSLEQLYQLVTTSWLTIPLGISIVIPIVSGGFGIWVTKDSYRTEDRIFIPILLGIVGIMPGVIIMGVSNHRHQLHIKHEKVESAYTELLKNPFTIEEVCLDDVKLTIKAQQNDFLCVIHKEVELAQRIPKKGEKWWLRLNNDKLDLITQEK